MKRTSFWTYFSSGYGTLWIVVLGVALISQSHIDTGAFGLFGFPVIALVYALVRRSSDAAGEAAPMTGLPPEGMLEFLDEHPHFLNAPQGLREAAFRQWLQRRDPGSR